MFCLWIENLLLFALLTRSSSAFFEIGSWNIEAKYGKALLFSKSSYTNTAISVALTCKKDTHLLYSWKLLKSDCDELFWYINNTIETSDLSNINIYKSIEVNHSDGKMECISDITVPLVNIRTKNDGSQLFMILGTCPQDHDCTTEKTFSFQVDILSNYGYLSAIEYPLRTFYGLLSLAYLSLGILWLAFICCHLMDLLRIQHYITLVILMGTVELVTLYALYETLNRTGVVVYSAVIFSELVSCIKRTLARFLVMIACVGYGITKSRLGSAYKSMLAICLLYFIFSATDSGLRAAQNSFKISKTVLLAAIPVIIIDLGIIWWSLSNLLHTLRETRLRRNIVKHRLYRIFANLLITVSVVSLICMVLSTYFLHWKSCTHAWRYIWIDQTFWQVLFFIILFTIVMLWRPSSTNKLYARSAFLDPDVEPPSEDFEELLINAVVSGPEDSSSKLHGQINSASKSEMRNSQFNDKNYDQAELESGNVRESMIQPMKVD